eukprot:TRINITY_DN42065_c0_g1_i1.p1 TRINITY_DN42065_c0_g1~~TRINITY_DN42065_c0_g1_i1.p1  ORF type:complete len:286 (+),score=32.89 TRINITY_DN42065_c0_g1_i1:114-971(+)
MALSMASSLVAAKAACAPSASLEATSLSSSRASLVSSDRVSWAASTVRKSAAVRASVATVRCQAAFSPPVVADTKQAFLKAYPKPIPTIYNTVIQEILVQQHLTRYNRTYKYDPVFALGFVTVFDQLLDGFPSSAEREAIFKAYIEALNEEPTTYRADAERLEKWAAELATSASLVDFMAGDGPVERDLKGIAERAKSGTFHYSRFFAVGLFRLLEITKESEPSTVEKLCVNLGIPVMSVNRDLDVYRGLLGKLTQAKELQREFISRENKKREEREKEKAEAKKE